MKKFGKKLWLGYLACMAVLLLGVLAYFLGTPWGYLSFYLRADDHLERYYGDDAQVASVSYDFKMKRYLGTAKHRDIPGETFVLRDERHGGETEIRSYYHLLLWKNELLARFQPEYPEYEIVFHLPVNGSPTVSPRAAEDYPSVFTLVDSGHFVTSVSVTIPADTTPESLFTLVTELDAALPQTDIGIWQGDAYAQLDWLDRAPREDCGQFISWLNQALNDE